MSPSGRSSTPRGARLDDHLVSGAGRRGVRQQFDAHHQAAVPDLAHAGERCDVLLQQRGELGGTLLRGCQAALLQQVEAGEGCRAAKRIAGVGVAVEEGAQLLHAPRKRS